MATSSPERSKATPLQWTTVIPEAAWSVEKVLTEDECQGLVDRATTNGIMQKSSLGDVRHRDLYSVTLQLPEMAAAVYERIKEGLPECVVIDGTSDHVGIQNHQQELYGTWRPYGLNPVWRVACYPGTGHFGPHRDGAHVEDEHHRSLLTLNGYLTDRPLGTGGATRFVRDDIEVHIEHIPIIDPEGSQKRTRFTTRPEDVLQQVESDKAGKAVIFFHDLMHDGEPLAEGSPLLSGSFAPKSCSFVIREQPRFKPKHKSEHESCYNKQKKQRAWATYPNQYCTTSTRIDSIRLSSILDTVMALVFTCYAGSSMCLAAELR